MQYAPAQVPGRFSAADERWLAALMVGTPLASLWPPGGRLSALAARALGAAYSAAAAAAAAVAVALRSELTAQARGDRVCYFYLLSYCPIIARCRSVRVPVAHGSVSKKPAVLCRPLCVPMAWPVFCSLSSDRTQVLR